MFVNGSNGDNAAAGGPLGLLFNLLLNEKLGLGTLADSPEAQELKLECEKLSRDAITTLAAK
jgi:hypothetical protein